MTLDATVSTHQETAEPASPNPRAAAAEEYWPDMEGLEHRNTVTDFGLPEGTFFDCAAVHLLTTATLDRLRELYPPGRFEVRRFRPNIVVETGNGEKDFVENAWIGQILLGGCVDCGWKHVNEGHAKKQSASFPVRCLARRDKLWRAVADRFLRKSDVETNT